MRRPPPRVSLSFPLIGLLALGSSAQRSDPRRPERAAFDPAPALALAADANEDGTVSADEWALLLSTIPRSDDGGFDARALALRAFRFDEDGDGTLTANDLERALSDGGSSFLARLAKELADVDRDGALSESERSAFLASAGGALDDARLFDWMRRAETIAPSDPNAMSAGVLLASLRASLDVDGDGRVTASDLESLRARLDANGDGAIDAGELAARGNAPSAFPGGREERWKVSDEAAARPPLMPWQRTLEDALALSKTSGKPLLVCVNIDGENASESFAYGRYRDPAFAALARAFVCVLASPDSHEPRERDDRGRRIPDPRFGRLVDSEHVDVEPQLYERYFEGRRVAPRHVGVSPDGEVLFDLYLLQDLSAVDAKLREFGRSVSEAADPSALGDDELLASPDAADRDEIERRFVALDERGRARLAALALSDVRATQQPELVRLALRDPSAVVRKQGAWTIAQHPSGAPLDAWPEAFALARGDAELGAALLASLRRARELAAGSDGEARSRRMLATFAELAQGSSIVDPERWRLALAASSPIAELAPDPRDFDATAEAMDALAALHERAPQDARLAAQLGAVRLRLARLQMAQASDPTYFLDDALEACRAALALEPTNARALAVHAQASYLLSDLATAGELAARALPDLVDDAGSPLALETLRVFAAARTRAVYDALAANEAWPAGCFADARCAREVLVSRSEASEADWTAYAELLGQVGAFGEQAHALRRALARFPLSGALHEALRVQVLRDAGSRALEAAYEEEPLASAHDANAPSLDWYHGLATLMAAEQDVQNAHPDDALAAYRRSIERFERSAEAAPDFAPSAAHYQCLAHAGAARLEAAAGNYSSAVDDLAQGLRASPSSADLADGLQKTPNDSVRELRAALERADDAALVQRLDTALGAEH